MASENKDNINSPNNQLDEFYIDDDFKLWEEATLHDGLEYLNDNERCIACGGDSCEWCN